MHIGFVKATGLQSHEQEVGIVEELCNGFARKVKSPRPPEFKLLVLPFRFRNEKSGRTKQHLIFISKRILWNKTMKDITADESSIQDQGVATFENNYSIFRQPFLFGLYRPIEDLDKIASEAFAGRIITMIQAHEEHNVDTSFIKKNYKCAPNQLETKNRILIAPPLNKRKKGAFKDEAIVTFSAKIHYWSNENGSKLSYRMD